MVWAVYQPLSLNSPNQLEKSGCGVEAEVQGLSSATIMCQHFKLQFNYLALFQTAIPFLSWEMEAKYNEN